MGITDYRSERVVAGYIANSDNMLKRAGDIRIVQERTDADEED